MFKCYQPLIHHSNNHIQDVLVVSYLANSIRTQIDLSNRLATAALTLGSSGEGIEQTNGTKEGTGRSGGGQRGGRGGRNNREQEPREP